LLLAGLPPKQLTEQRGKKKNGDRNRIPHTKNSTNHIETRATLFSSLRHSIVRILVHTYYSTLKHHPQKRTAWHEWLEGSSHKQNRWGENSRE
jgi:hypothetical protein